MNAHSHQFAATVMPRLWADRITLARMNHALAPVYIRSIRDDAAACAKRIGNGNRGETQLCECIVQECEYYLDSLWNCAPHELADELDQIDALICEDD